MHCIRCGKSGIFLRVNDAMLCKQCAAAQAEKDRKQEEERIRKRDEVIRQHEAEKARQYSEAKDFYDLLKSRYRIIRDDMVHPQTVGLSAKELDLKYHACVFLEQQLPLWRSYPKFEDVYVHDCRQCAWNSMFMENPYLPLGTFYKDSRPDFDQDIPKMVSKLISISTKLILALHEARFPKEHKVKQYKQETKHNTQGKPYFVVGTKFYEKNILKLANKNIDYSITKQELIDSMRYEEDIPRYTFSPEHVELTPEPENPHDSNAIMVIVDKQHVGYIKATSCLHLLKAIQQSRIQSISCLISGGPYKRVVENYDIERDKESYTIRRGEIPYTIELSVVEKSAEDSQ